MSTLACYIKFEPATEDGLEHLSQTVRRLAAEKNPRLGLDTEWLQHFTDLELQSFWWPEEAELKEDDYWIIEQIFNGEYILLGVRRLDDNEAVLEFEPIAHPYGGADPLCALVRSFGHRIIGIDDGFGYEAGDR